jgi:hypothetical protein
MPPPPLPPKTGAETDADTFSSIDALVQIVVEAEVDVLPALCLLVAAATARRLEERPTAAQILLLPWFAQ